MTYDRSNVIYRSIDGMGTYDRSNVINRSIDGHISTQLSASILQRFSSGFERDESSGVMKVWILESIGYVIRWMDKKKKRKIRRKEKENKIK